MGNNWSNSDYEGQSSHYFESDVDIYTNKQRDLIPESSPPASQAKNEEYSAAQESPLSSPSLKEDNSTPSQADHSENATNKEKGSAQESSPASPALKESGCTHSQTDNSNIPHVNSVSKELELIKPEQDKPIKTKHKPRATDITSEGIEIEWTKPEQDSAQNVTSYTILYHSASDPDDQWNKKTVNGTEERVTVSGLTENDIYYFKVQSVCNRLNFEESETSKPVTMESPTQKNILNKAWRARAKWCYIGIQLGREGDLEAIRISNHHAVDDCFTEMIKKWLNDKGGSWRKLIDALSHETVGYYGLAKSVAASLGLSAIFHGHASLHDDEFKKHLKCIYKGLTPTQTSADTWPPSATCKVFNLAMIRMEDQSQDSLSMIPTIMKGKVDDVLRERYPILLENVLFESSKRMDNQNAKKVVLLEGAPGCGKSTLSVHISQQWGEGKLFTEFKYAVLVQLRDPEVQAASCVADLLPARDSEMQQKAAKEITANYGEDILFILDGWDELPSSLRKKNSVFHQIIQSGLLQKSPLHKSTVIVTSRPIASGDLYYSTRIKILGFTPEELKIYFTDCLQNDPKAVETLFGRIQENPVIASSCYLPMNASILVHLFIQDKYTLPTTQYGIFSELVLSCIYRHHEERTQLKNLTLESLQEIPEVIREPFLFICELAYQGVMNDKVIFSRLDNDMKTIFSKLPGDINTLGLLQGVEGFVKRGKALSYNFLHLSIQEILAGFYIATQLPDDEQVIKFNELFDKSRFSAVFQFYAAITKLQTPGIKDVVIRIAKETDKTLLISLLHCIYEAQVSHSLCESVAQQLQNELDLSDTMLNPSNCLCIGYFLSHIWKTVTRKFKVNLKNCNIGDQGYKYLVSGLHENLDTHSAATTSFTMNLSNNSILHCDAHLSTLLKVGCIEDLKLGRAGTRSSSKFYNKLGPLQGTLVAEQLKNNTILTRLNLRECGLTSQSATSLAEALITNTHLEELNISGNLLNDDAIQHLAHALQVNQHLKRLELAGCGITDVGLEYLAKSIENNRILNSLNVSITLDSEKDNLITEKIIPILIKNLKNNQALTNLSLPLMGYLQIEEAINDVRQRSPGLPLLKVEGKYTTYLKLLYKRLTPTLFDSHTWPPPTTNKMFNLAMIKSKGAHRGHEFIRQIITGKVDNILRKNVSIDLKDVLQAEDQETKEKDMKRKVVLLEGAPGCGKSTLSVYICNQWGKGKLFTEFKYVILVRLQERQVQAASCVADLLPCRDSEMRQQAAKDIIANEGEGVLFILDGWDNLPSSLRKNSIICDIVQPGSLKSSLLFKCRLIVTSRPIASSDLHLCASTQIEILGFTSKEVEAFLTECCKHDTKAMQTLLERILENPALFSSCYLPLNASIVRHLFNFDYDFLGTQYKIFSGLVRNYIYRHCTCIQFKDLSGIKSLQKLPEDLKEPFQFLCKLAYQGIMDDQVIFSSLPGDINTLGLLQGVESFVRQEKMVSYNFLHLSIQEFLAGFYIATQLSNDEQVSKFSELFNKPRFSAVFQFYAAITELQTPGIKNVVTRIATKCGDFHYQFPNEDQSLMVSLLRCLYEAQIPSLCESVAQHLQQGLDLTSTTLTPLDCLCIGYFLSCACKMAISSKFNVNLGDCNIGDQGCKYLVSGLHKNLCTHSELSTLLTVDLSNNAITDCGAHLSTLLKVCCIEDLRFGSHRFMEPFQCTNNKFGSLQGVLVEQLKKNSMLRRLDLIGCDLTSSNAKSLAEVLTTNTHLEELNISDNALGDDSIHHLTYALQVNQHLKKLGLVNCGITDIGFEYIAKSMQNNNALKTLNVATCAGLGTENQITVKIVSVLIECLQINHTLTELYLPDNLDSSTPDINKAVNDIRQRKGLPLVEVKVRIKAEAEGNTTETESSLA